MSHLLVRTYIKKTYAKCYIRVMEVPITLFRRRIFELVDQARQGEPLWILHKGNRFRIVPEIKTGDRFSRITPMQVIHPESGEDDRILQEEMRRAWEDEWSIL